MLDHKALLRLSTKKNASDVFITVGKPPTLKVEGVFESLEHPPLSKDDTETFVMELIKREEDYKRFLEQGEHDFSLSLEEIGRFRVGVYFQRGSMSAVIRVLSFDDEEKFSYPKPDAILNLWRETKGLVLITGPTGSGKSTTISQIVDQINKNRTCHIITLEDPIEHLHKHQKSIVDQREIGIDTKSYAQALRAAVRQAPDVVQIGALRDPDTIQEALKVSEMGHLVISSLHTLGVAKTLDRLIGIFPADKQSQIRYQLSTELVAIVSQQLLPSIPAGRVPAFEVMILTPEIRKLIMENRLEEIDRMLQKSEKDTFIGMNPYIDRLHKEGSIAYEVAREYRLNREDEMSSVL